MVNEKMKMMLLLFIYLFALVYVVHGNGERYDIETYNIMQILRPVGSSMSNGTNTKSPVSIH